MTSEFIKEVLSALAIGLIIVGIAHAGDKVEIESAEDAIVRAQVMDTVTRQVEYLLYYAHQFVENNQYEEAQDVAQYILEKLDHDSVEASDILEEAKLKIKATNVVEVNPVEIKF